MVFLKTATRFLPQMASASLQIVYRFPMAFLRAASILIWFLCVVHRDPHGALAMLCGFGKAHAADNS